MYVCMYVHVQQRLTKGILQDDNSPPADSKVHIDLVWPLIHRDGNRVSRGSEKVVIVVSRGSETVERGVLLISNIQSNDDSI